MLHDLSEVTVPKKCLQTISQLNTHNYSEIVIKQKNYSQKFSWKTLACKGHTILEANTVDGYNLSLTRP